MLGVDVDLTDGRRQVGSHVVVAVLDRAPEVHQQPVEINGDLNAWNRWPGQQHGQRPCERLDVALRVAQVLPHQGSDFALGPEVREEGCQDDSLDICANRACTSDSTASAKARPGSANLAPK